ncbi:MAG: pitrilysin family protein [Bacteroidaceae bacterium]
MKINRTQQPLLHLVDKVQLLSPQRKWMKNGVPLSIINTGDQDVLHLEIIISAGRYQQDYPLQAMFTNRMLREGTAQLASKEIAEKLDFYGSWVELSTSGEHSFISLSSLSKYFEQTVQLLAQMLFEPTFPAAELTDVLLRNKEQFLVNQSKVDYLSIRAFNTLVFGKEHPLGRTIHLADYDHLKSEQLVDFYQRYYSSANCFIYLTGKVTDESIAIIQNYFGDKTWGTEQKREEPHTHKMPELHPSQHFIYHPNALQSSLRLGGQLMEINNPDSYAMNVLITILGGYFGSRLMKNIREDKGYTYDISAALPYYSGQGILIISTQAAPDYMDAILEEIYKEIELLQSTLVTEEELDRVRNYMYGNLCRNYEGPIDLADYWIYVETNHIKDNHFEKSLWAIKNTSAQDIQRLACTYLKKESMIKVVVGEKNERV